MYNPAVAGALTTIIANAVFYHYADPGIPPDVAKHDNYHTGR